MLSSANDNFSIESISIREPIITVNRPRQLILTADRSHNAKERRAIALLMFPGILDAAGQLIERRLAGSYHAQITRNLEGRHKLNDRAASRNKSGTNGNLRSR